MMLLELLSDPSVWASFLTLLVLEIVLGIDNVIFISLTAARLPPDQRRRARLLGLSLALVTRVLLLLSVVWLASLTRPVFSALGHEVSWRDMILLAGGLFLIFKASTEIFDEVEGDAPHPRSAAAGFAMVIAQIVVLDMVFSLDSIITAIGIATHPEVMVAAIVVSVLLMMVASGPIADFVAAHPSTKMLALAFLVMVGMALVADGFGVHVERGFIYAAMLFSGAVEALNLWRAKRRARARAQNRSEDG